MSAVTIRAEASDQIGADIQSGGIVRLTIGSRVRIELPYQQALRAIERLTSAADNLWTCDGCGEQHLSVGPTRYVDKPGKRFCGWQCAQSEGATS